MTANIFRDFRPKVDGRVENPVQLSLSEIDAFGKNEHMTVSAADVVPPKLKDA
jgi:DMSO/TMAO reductase YedYZ molybdopterin-dependent catalytic subunit